MRDVAGPHQRAVHASKVDGQHVVDEHLHGMTTVSTNFMDEHSSVCGAPT